MLGGANKISEVVARGCPEGGESHTPQGKVIVFPLGGASSFQERGMMRSPSTSGTKIPQPLTQHSLQCLPLQTLLAGLQVMPSSLLWGPRCAATNTKPVLSPFKGKQWVCLQQFSSVPRAESSQWGRLLDLLIWVL